MPSPRIHQVVRRPSFLGYPRPFAGELSGSQFNSATFTSGTGETGYNTKLADHGIANVWTISFWFNPSSTPQSATETVFQLKDPANTNNQITISILGAVASDPLNIIIADSAGSVIKDYRYNSQTTSTTTKGLYTFTWDGTTLLFYRDTAAVTASTLTTDTTGTMTNTDRAVGMLCTVAGGSTSNGVRGSFAIWNTCLSATEIFSLWAEGLGAQANLNGSFDEYASASSLVHWWRPGIKITSVVRDVGTDFAAGAASKPYNYMGTTNTTTANFSSVTAGNPRFTQPAYASLATNEYFANSTQQALGFSTSFTISFWWRWTAGNNTLVTLFDLGPASGNANRILIQIGHNLSNDPLQLSMYNSSATLCKDMTWDRYCNITNGAVISGSTFFTLTWDGATDTLKLYRNGRDLGTATTISTNNPCTRTDDALGVWIGATKAAGNATTAAYHSMAVWDKALTTGEIATIWNEGYPTVDISKNTLGYYGADNLKHWWKLTRPPGTVYNAGTAFTTDYVKTGGINVESNSANLTAADILLTTGSIPFGHCIRLNGSMRMEAPAQTWNIANSWTISWNVNPGSITGNQTLFQIGTNAGANTIRVDFVDAATDYLDVYLYDSAGVLVKNYRYNTPWSAGTWRTQALTWNGTTLTYYTLATATAASSTPTNGSGTMTDTSRPMFLGGLADYTQMLTSGTVLTTMAVWNSVLTSGEIFTIHKNQMTSFDFRQNMGDYASAANLKHWWKFGADPNSLGRDFAGSIHLMGTSNMYDATLHAHQQYSENT